MAEASPGPGTRDRLLRLLADGAPRSGERLAEDLGISRAAVWKQVHQLQAAGYPVSAEVGQGYRWDRPWPLHEADALRAGLGESWAGIPLTVLPEVDSTNRWLRARGSGGPEMVIAERQTGGRGRLDRGWASPPGGIYLSVAWSFEALESGPAGLGLLVSLHLAETLRALGATRVGVKWPNDVMHEGAKLAGILCELSGDPMGRCTVVVGTGINWRADLVGPLEPGREAAGVADILPAPPPRPGLAGQLAAAVLEACQAYPDGFAPALRERWPALDTLAGRRITLQLANRIVTGEVQGVDETGALILRTAQGLERHLSGDTRVLPS
ncbi:biotin--[acetyl-CoA-carboxylase] ligase [Sediminicurvatus halobius]|uniref:Bifunctional ligase/repressor BirA n=1 Tax=Sediminicurvatus halobius TaxID=2182432 RepID=A0A2U2N0F1_9GAMM|nr:biotin--[acetyl-CoA-carboxylase] ligase [Spiribacter halobius]PWG62721.1 biotin--[acetyl-CoA-carboxylase] ligase [Spiribacter halobius]UEX77389.1 biotin--[acetyl-CoA-carboxylase] ligase [Spiribacter halobius]